MDSYSLNPPAKTDGGLVSDRTSRDPGSLSAGRRGPDVSDMLAPTDEFISEAVAEAEADPASADKVALRVKDGTSPLVGVLASARAPKPIISECNARLALAMAQCAVVFTLATWKWKEGLALLDEALRSTNDGEAKDAIEAEIAAIKKNQALLDGMTPVEKAPSLFTFNTMGFHLWGKSNFDPATETYLTTRFLVVFYLPFIPLGRYRVLRVNNYYQFIGRAPLRKFDWLMPVCVFCGLALLINLGSILAWLHG